MTRILFICMGNICRSPCAEGIMQNLVKQRGLENEFECDSAGTIDYHQGDPADQRMREHASLRGYELNSIARKFILQDFENFDWIITWMKIITVKSAYWTRITNLLVKSGG